MDEKGSDLSFRWEKTRWKQKKTKKNLIRRAVKVRGAWGSKTTKHPWRAWKKLVAVLGRYFVAGTPYSVHRSWPTYGQY